MRRVLGIDYGTKRVGLAISDELGLTARPLDVVARPELTDALRRWATEYDIGTVVVGLPTSLGGHEGDSALAARRLGEEVREVLDAKIVFVDERFTSRMAERVLLETGMRRRRRRETVDKMAAAIVVQDYLDRLQGNPAAHDAVERPGER